MTGRLPQGGGGPWLAVAALCERVIEEKDGTLTLVRLIDRFQTSAIGHGTPETMPETPIAISLVAAFKAGAARGRSDFQVILEGPDGLRNPIAQAVSIQFEGDERGANLVMNLRFSVRLEGLYWFDLFLDGRLATRVPLRVVYQRQETGPAPQAQ